VTRIGSAFRIREERLECVREIVWCFFGHMVPRVDSLTADIGGPFSPDRERVTVEVFKVVLQRPQRKKGHQKPPPRSFVCFFVGPVERQPGPVILEHGSDYVAIWTVFPSQTNQAKCLRETAQANLIG
jgi:hypothetical protein